MGLRHPGRIRIIEHMHIRSRQMLGEQLMRINPHPTGINICRRQHHLILNHARQCDTHRIRPFGNLYNFGAGSSNRIRGCWLRGEYFDAFTNELTSVKINSGALDTRATNINTKSNPGHKG